MSHEPFEVPAAPGLDVLSVVPWHSLTREQALQRLHATAQGLSAAEAQARRARWGANALPRSRGNPWPVLFLKQFRSALIYVLLAAAVLSLLIEEFSDAAFIMAVLLINAAVGTVQEYKAQTGAQALDRMMRINARALRSGRRVALDSSELVPGDVVVLEAGDAVPADIRLLSAAEFEADESLLTGESLPVAKSADAIIADPGAPVAERQNMLHAGTHVVEGRARGMVCRTGAATEVGKIASSLNRPPAPPPLVQRLRRFTLVITVTTMGFIALLVAGQLWRGAGIVETLFVAVALAVSAIPEGLPVAITVALAIASHRMAVRNVIVRLLPAVEGLGTCTFIASDKTGTLTANQLTVKQVTLADGHTVEIGGQGLQPAGTLSHDGRPLDPQHAAALRDLAATGMLCNEAEYWLEDGEPDYSGDTVDVAFLVLAAKAGLSAADLAAAEPQTDAIPFQSQRRFAAVFTRGPAGARVHVKGAAEAVLPMCRGVDALAAQEMLHHLTTDGYRVLAVAAGDAAPETPDRPPLRDLRFLGFVGLIDPVREGVPRAIASCRSAGIAVAMVTGDHPSTALAIARQLGIASGEDQVLTGAELKSLTESPAELATRLRHSRVFARLEPAQKTEIVEALQRDGHFVAVTGDGVNDAPALRAANIGVAMGGSGTDVARQAADLIVADDNFASIVNGVEEGRVAYDNVRKVTWLLIATGAAEILLFFMSFLFAMPLPLGAVQLLWLNLVTNGLQDVALAFEAGEPGVLARPPRPPRQPLFDRRMIEETVVAGLFMGGVAFAVFYWMVEDARWTEAQARNVLLLIMVLFENAHVFNCRSERRSAFAVPLRANRLLIGTVIVAQGVHIAAMYTPGLSAVLGLQPVSLTVWLAMAVLAFSLVAVMEIYKRLRGTALDRRGDP